MFDRLATKIIMGAVSAVLIVGGGWYVKNLIQRVAVLEIAAQSEKIRADDLARTVAISQTAIEQLGADFAKARKEMEARNAIFDEHDFPALYQARPHLVISRINNGHDDARRLLEAATSLGQ